MTIKNNQIEQNESTKVLESLPKETVDALLKLLTSKTDEEQKKSWKDDLIVDSKGRYKPFIGNYRLWLENGSKYAGKLKYNEFFDCIEYDGKTIKDSDEDYIEADAEKFFNHNVSSVKLRTAISNYAHDNKYNPLADYLYGLKDKWDGVKRLETFIIDLLEAEDTPLNRFFTKSWMVGAVKRALNPGCQFDCVLALQGGKQGSGKSSLFRRIALDKFYKTFGSGEFMSKDSIDKMNKSWISVLDEFDKFSDKEIADLKCKITETSMACRKSYERNTQEYKVHWVYAATTNADNFLCDLTGDEYERRYWIIECHKSTEDSKVNDTLTDEYVDQLWAEAVSYYFKDPNKKLYLASDNPLYEGYKKYQRKFKKTAANTDIDYINEILEYKYKYADGKDGCKTVVEFVDQCSGRSIYDDTNTKYINKVPCSYVKNALKQIFKVEYGYGYVKIFKSMLLNDGNKWKIKDSDYYNGVKVSNILVRTNKIELNDKEEDKNDAPF